MTCTTEEFLISRIVGGEAQPADWETLRTLAAANPDIWHEIAETQADQEAMRRLVDRAGARANAIDLDERAPTIEIRSNPFRLSRWGGWALAAALLLAWGVTSSILNQPSRTNVQPRMQHAGFTSARDAYQAYLDQGVEEGLVLSHEPSRVLIQTRPLDDGKGMELVYYLQTIERSVVDNLYQFRGQDELGRAALVNYEQPAGQGTYWIGD